MTKNQYPEQLQYNPKIVITFSPNFFTLQNPSSASMSVNMSARVACSLAALCAFASAQTYKSSFTMYGSGDTFGSQNCQTTSAACGFYTSPGYSAAVSQNLYGVGPDQGAGPGCGTCWALTGETDSSGNALSNAGTGIVVKVNNLCPGAAADGNPANPLCSQPTTSDSNSVGTYCCLMEFQAPWR